MRIFIRRRSDGGVLIMTFQTYVLDYLAINPELLEEVVEAELDKWPVEMRADVASWQAIPDEALLADTTFQDAWVVTPEHMISVDMPKARDIHRDRLRLMRAPKFEPLERAQRSSLSRGDTATAAVVEERLQALRDVTDDPAIDLAQTPDELKQAIPPALTFDPARTS
jgi:hypothetical protein